MESDTTLVSDAWQQGFEAYNRDASEPNPYAEDDGQHEEWLDGWLVAKNENAEDEDETD